MAKKQPEHIYFTGRNTKSAASLISDVETTTKCKITFIECDLTSLKSVEKAVKEFTAASTRLDILLCNAGIMAVPPSLTTDGYEIQFATNHLGHALLTKLLMPTIERTANEPGSDVRIVYTSSIGFAFANGIAFDTLKSTQSSFGGSWSRYAQSKLANILYTQELARRYPKITSVSIHPGVISTGLVGNISMMKKAFVYMTSYFMMVSEEEGVRNGLWAATVDKSELTNGQFYEPVGVVGRTTKASQNKELAAELWDWTAAALESYKA